VSGNDASYLWGDRRPHARITPAVRAMTINTDVTSWRASNGCIGLGIHGLPAIGEERHAPKEVYDGLFYVPPVEGGSGFRMWRNEVDS
jgi:hypothetical protein